MPKSQFVDFKAVKAAICQQCLGFLVVAAQCLFHESSSQIVLRHRPILRQLFASINFQRGAMGIHRLCQQCLGLLEKPRGNQRLSLATRHMLPLPSSVNSRAPSCATVTPTGRPQTLRSSATKPVTKSSYSPVGTP